MTGQERGPELMSGGAEFGRHFAALRRRRARKSLRQFCNDHGFDPGNVSKMERGKLPPPQSSEILERYAAALGIEEGSDDWCEFFDLAAAGRGEIPPDIQSDADLAQSLLAHYRTLCAGHWPAGEGGPAAIGAAVGSQPTEGQIKRAGSNPPPETAKPSGFQPPGQGRPRPTSRNPPPRLVTTAEAATILGLTTDAVRKLAARGQLPAASRTCSGDPLFQLDPVLNRAQWLTPREARGREEILLRDLFRDDRAEQTDIARASGEAWRRRLRLLAQERWIAHVQERIAWSLQATGIKPDDLDRKLGYEPGLTRRFLAGDDDAVTLRTLGDLFYGLGRELAIVTVMNERLTP